MPHDEPDVIVDPQFAAYTGVFGGERVGDAAADELSGDDAVVARQGAAGTADVAGSTGGRAAGAARWHRCSATYHIAGRAGQGIRDGHDHHRRQHHGRAAVKRTRDNAISERQAAARVAGITIPAGAGVARRPRRHR